MRVCAGLARTKLTLLTRSSAASRTTDTKCLSNNLADNSFQINKPVSPSFWR